MDAQTSTSSVQGIQPDRIQRWPRIKLHVWSQESAIGYHVSLCKCLLASFGSISIDNYIFFWTEVLETKYYNDFQDLNTSINYLFNLRNHFHHTKNIAFELLLWAAVLCHVWLMPMVVTTPWVNPKDPGLAKTCAENKKNTTFHYLYIYIRYLSISNTRSWCIHVLYNTYLVYSDRHPFPAASTILAWSWHRSGSLLCEVCVDT